MTYTQMFMAFIVLVDAIAGVLYLGGGDYRRAIIWVAYSVATAAITF